MLYRLLYQNFNYFLSNKLLLNFFNIMYFLIVCVCVYMYKFICNFICVYLHDM